MGVSGFVAFVLTSVFCAGFGQPHTYWHRIGDVQIFEGPDSVVLFAEVELVTFRPGLIRSPPVVSEPVRLFQVEVSRDSTVHKLPLGFQGFTTFNINNYPILKLPDAFYLVQAPSLGRPFFQLHKVSGDRIEPLPVEESAAILRSIDHKSGEGEVDRLDRVSERNGWRRLDGTSYEMFRHSLSDPVVSDRHEMRVWVASGAILAESFVKDERWAKSLLTVNTRRWQSYRRPPASP